MVRFSIVISSFCTSLPRAIVIDSRTAPTISAELLVREAQVEPHPLRRDPAEALGELTQLEQQAALDAGLQGDRHRQLAVGDLRREHPHEVRGDPRRR